MVHSKMAMTYVQHYFDPDRDWVGTNPGWYEAAVKTQDSDEHTEIVKWLYDNIDNPERHCRWTKSLYESHFKFRYERDYIHFRLRW